MSTISSAVGTRSDSSTTCNFQALGVIEQSKDAYYLGLRQTQGTLRTVRPRVRGAAGSSKSNHLSLRNRARRWKTSSDHLGGLDQVVTVLSELADEIDAAALAAAANTAPITWVQRLGYMLELVQQENAAAAIREFVHAHAREYTMLVPGRRFRSDSS